MPKPLWPRFGEASDDPVRRVIPLDPGAIPREGASKPMVKHACNGLGQFFEVDLTLFVNNQED